jgi:TonB family protein
MCRSALHRWGCAAALLVLSCSNPPAARADATIRYQSQISPSALIPQSLQSTLSSQTVRLKGNKAWNNAGDAVTIIDFAKQEVTLISAAHRIYATVPLSQYSEKSMALVSDLLGFTASPTGSPAETAAAGLPEGAAAGITDMLAKMKTKVDSRLTGRKETILGVQTSEREIGITIEVPMPEGSPMPNLSMKMAIHVWSATPEEILRTPAIRELATYGLWQRYFLDFGRISESIAGLDISYSLMKEIEKDHSVVLRTSMEMEMPSIPGLSTSSTPIMQMKTEAVELSAAPVDETLFQIPKEYAQAAFEQLMKTTIQDMARPAGVQGTGAAAESFTPPSGAKAYIPNLRPLSEEAPPRPEEARTKGIYGEVELLVTLDTSGSVTEAEALSGPELLRKPAVEAVKKWRFRPALRDGRPVVAMTDANVMFAGQDSGEFHMPEMNIGEMIAADARRDQLRAALPRSPEQTLADLEQDSGGGEESRRFYALGDMAKAAFDIGETGKAAAYASELLSTAANRAKDWSNGDAAHVGNTILGLLAVQKGELKQADERLLNSAPDGGSAVLNSFGPSMKLAKALLDKGERSVVLEYLSLCRKFWKQGAGQLDQWTQAIVEGRTPQFGMSLR